MDKNTYPSAREKYSVHLENDICMIDEEGPISFHDQTVIKHRYNLKKLLKQISFFLFCGKLDLKKIDKKLNTLTDALYRKGRALGYQETQLREKDDIKSEEKTRLISELKNKFESNFSELQNHI